eukprot:TRINITY_DN13113_c0_g1_i1.p1 TRINITY_DN13113_c0_g1~~TRINITY_DN13113_c0_g1_i1.p1  ORF type:complete len:893 (-),score=210.17 TRINITY_DN13113_c0_g1_i1:27-2705(-)
MATWDESDNDSVDSNIYSGDEQGSISSAEDDQPNKFMIGADSGEEEEEKRIVKTATEKRFQEMTKWVGKVQMAMKNDDWAVVETEWDGLVKCVIKSKSLLEQNFPKFYASFLVELDDKINDTLSNKETMKAMKAKKAHFFNRIKLHFRKFYKEDKLTLDKMNQYRLDPDSFKEELEDDEDDKKKDKNVFRKTSSEENSDEEKSKKDKAKEPEEKPEEWTNEKIDKKVKQLLKERGTKTYSTGLVYEHIKTFRFLLSKLTNLARQLTLRFDIVNALFDTNFGTSHLNTNTWKKVYNEIVVILEALFDNPNLKLIETLQGEESDADKLNTTVYGHLLYSVERLHDEYIRSLQNTDSHSTDFVVRLSHERYMLILLQACGKYYQINSEFKQMAGIACRQLDCLYYKHETSTGGIEEPTLIETNDDEPEPEPEPEPVPEPEQKEQRESDEEHKEVVKEVEKDVELTPPKNVAIYINLREAVSNLTSLVYTHSQDEQKRRAMLQHVYHLALHDQYMYARDILLMTHLQEKIHQARVPDQIMFNRAMAQLGLAAFRMGRIEDTNNCLQDIILGGRDKAKELLAQGITRYQGEKNADQEKQERSRQIPYHMHINLDLIESVLLVSGMLLEIPYLTQYRFRDSKRKALSKHFRKSYDFYNERQYFTGPPENTKESILASAKAMEKGDWKTAHDTICALEIWKLTPHPESVLEIIGRLIKEQALRTYLFLYGPCYESIHVSHLASMFDLSETSAHAMVSSMIVSSELQASFDQPSGAIIFTSPNIQPLQYLALNFADKINFLLEGTDQNETRGGYERRWKGGEEGRSERQKEGFVRKERGERTERVDRGDRGDRGGDRGEKRSFNYGGLSARNIVTTSQERQFTRKKAGAGAGGRGRQNKN